MAGPVTRDGMAAKLHKFRFDFFRVESGKDMADKDRGIPAFTSAAIDGEDFHGLFINGEKGPLKWKQHSPVGLRRVIRRNFPQDFGFKLGT